MFGPNTGVDALLDISSLLLKIPSSASISRPFLAPLDNGWTLRHTQLCLQRSRDGSLVSSCRLVCDRRSDLKDMLRASALDGARLNDALRVIAELQVAMDRAYRAHCLRLKIMLTPVQKRLYFELIKSGLTARNGHPGDAER